MRALRLQERRKLPRQSPSLFALVTSRRNLIPFHIKHTELIRNSTFTNEEERTGVHAEELPECVYRMFFEDSGTLSYYQPKECLKKSRDAPEAKLDPENGFQSLKRFVVPKHLTPERILLPFNPRRRTTVPPHVAAYHRLQDAQARCHVQYTESRAVGQRITATVFDMRTLIPGTMHGTLQTFKSTFRGNTLVRLDHNVKERSVKIPIWIRNVARPADGSPISVQELEDSGADMWVRGVEMRNTGPTDMNYGAADTHDNDWLCCGPVPRSFTTKVMPFDGEKLHQKKTSQLIRSKESIEIYLFNWDLWKWQHNPDLTDFRPYRLEQAGDRRGPPDNDDDGQEPGLNQPRRKRIQILPLERAIKLGFSTITTIVDLPHSFTGEAQLPLSLKTVTSDSRVTTSPGLATFSH
ncbi:hypothetical protein EK21DRAFT_72835 [Setomelanomma holmii]|uniref:Uncharacterized protein n=1 Tax=Setomelanomma holmii TaxID=210430 RepID=A0A9P4H2K0_9PLEO|nr:hypothetical protein EK21DRAFT_72835 [Setomelanomma holmii]